MTPDLTSLTAVSTDGTRIGYHSFGDGAGIVVVHGAMQSGLSQLDLGSLLASSHRVHLMDRRGRGDSGPYPDNTSTATEVADVRAVLSATGSHYLVGVSSGAILAARAALLDSTIERLALFEPPLSIDGSLRLGGLPRFDDAIARGDLASAMGVAMKISEMGPAWMFGLPVPVLAAASRHLLRSDAMRAMAAALPADVRIVEENADRVADFAALRIPTLLLDGTATRPFLRKSIAALAEVIPGARHVELQGQWHGVTQNRAERGRPQLVAPALLEFFADRAPAPRAER